MAEAGVMAISEAIAAGIRTFNIYSPPTSVRLGMMDLDPVTKA
jgi:hypothetical protein